MVPWNMSATTWPVRFKPEGMFGRLYATVTAPIVSGICRAGLGKREVWLLLRGASEAAKSTFVVIKEFIPDPLPTP